MFSFDGIFGGDRGRAVVEKKVVYPARAVVPGDHPRILPQLGFERSGYTADLWEERDYTDRGYFYLPKLGITFDFTIEDIEDNWHPEELNQLAAFLGNAPSGRGVFQDYSAAAYFSIIQENGVTYPLMEYNDTLSLTVVSQTTGKSEDFSFSVNDLCLEPVTGVHLEYTYFDILSERNPLNTGERLFAGIPNKLALSPETLDLCYQDLVDGDDMDRHIWQSYTNGEAVIVSNVRFQSAEHIYRVFADGEVVTAYRPKCECVATLTFEDGFSGNAELSARDFDWKPVAWTMQAPMPALA